ncbi:MAG: hypothetical protein HQM14_08845 [SAR324 cluster bacterium]|nr:hypothetical protein [SAR324 cluster bacterium]
MKYRLSEHISTPLYDLKPKPKSGLVLISTLIIMAIISTLLLQWYQNEIQYRLQAQVSLEYHSLLQELEGILGQSIISLQNYSDSELRQNNIVIPNSELQSFFPGWVVQSIPAKKASFLKLDVTHHAFSQTHKFDVLFHFSSYNLSDIPFLNLSLENSAVLPENLIFPRSNDQKLTIEAPRFPLKAPPLNDSFDHVFQGEVQIAWNEDNITFFQKSDELIFPYHEIDGLSVQITGNASITGDLTHSAGKQIFLKIIGNLNFKLPSKSTEFSEPPPHLFLHVTEKVSVQTSSSAHPTIQISGYLWIENGCLDIHASIQSIYWTGSLACHLTSARFSHPFYLLHAQYPHEPPASFDRVFLQFNGVQSVDL